MRKSTVYGVEFAECDVVLLSNDKSRRGWVKAKVNESVTKINKLAKSSLPILTVKLAIITSAENGKWILNFIYESIEGCLQVLSLPLLETPNQKDFGELIRFGLTLVQIIFGYERDVNSKSEKPNLIYLNTLLSKKPLEQWERRLIKVGNDNGFNMDTAQTSSGYAYFVTGSMKQLSESSNEFNLTFLFPCQILPGLEAITIDYTGTLPNSLEDANGTFAWVLNQFYKDSYAMTQLFD